MGCRAAATLTLPAIAPGKFTSRSNLPDEQWAVNFGRCLKSGSVAPDRCADAASKCTNWLSTTTDSKVTLNHLPEPTVDRVPSHENGSSRLTRATTWANMCDRIQQAP